MDRRRHAWRKIVHLRLYILYKLRSLDIMNINRNLDAVVKEIREIFHSAGGLGRSKIDYLKENRARLYGANLHGEIKNLYKKKEGK